jgi:UDPglucose 6-dehydrogenase/GDP-mannose 6-dehydrogenase
VRVAVVGTGYVGLVTAACLSEHGHEVVCVDLDRARLKQILRGTIPFYEPGLEELVRRHAGRTLLATDDIADAVRRSQLSFVAVGTPSVDGRIDLRAVLSAVQSIGASLRESAAYHVVVVKSTVVPGTTDGPVRTALEEATGRISGSGFGIAMNPEFLTEGQAVADFMEPDRLVLGADDARTGELLLELYASFPRDVPRVVTNTRTAEMIKYASNTLLATMISFSNEIANLCAAVGGVDVVDVLEGVRLSRYLSPRGGVGMPVVRAPISSFLEAGCGYGGSCLPKDTAALIAMAAELDQPTPLLRAVAETNARRPDEVIRLAETHLGDLEGLRAAVLGLAFKPDTDDVRESPAIPIVTRLLARGASVVVHDPVVTELPDAIRCADVTLTNELGDTLARADVAIVVTRWDAYQDIPAILAELDDPPLLVDGRRMIDRRSVARYAGIGRS